MSTQITPGIEMTREEFFAYVESHPDKRFDFIDGELVEVSPKPLHGRLQSRLVLVFGLWLRDNPIGETHTEVLHILEGEKFIPDISINATRADGESAFETPPLLAIEIRSDTQSRTAQRRKALRYIAHGTPAVLLVLPGEQIELFTSETGDESLIFKPGETVSGIPGMADLEIDVAELFA